MKFKYLVNIFLIGTFFVCAFLFHSFFISTPSYEEKTVEIPRGYGLSSIAKLLVNEGVIKDKNMFLIYSKLSGSGSNLKAGEYLFESGLTIKGVFDKLEKGDVILRKVTIPEGLNIKEIAEILEKNKVVSKKSFIELARSEETYQKIL